MAKSFVKNKATPLACEVKLAKLTLPPHSAFTSGSISLPIRVSDNRIILALFFFKTWKTFDLLGFFPMELGLKAMILNLELEGLLFFTFSGSYFF